MGNSASEYTKHDKVSEYFCSKIHYDIASMACAREAQKNPLTGRLDMSQIERLRHLRKDKLWKMCHCFDGLKTEKEIDSCVNRTWTCTKFEIGRSSAQECKDWNKYSDIIDRKIISERNRIFVDTQ